MCCIVQLSVEKASSVGRIEQLIGQFGALNVDNNRLQNEIVSLRRENETVKHTV
jgi:hypothetical protein